jgi:hypothetical protein
MDKKEKARTIFKAFRKGSIELDLNTNKKHFIEYELVCDDEIIVKSFFGKQSDHMVPKPEIIIQEMILKPTQEQVKILQDFLKDYHRAYIKTIEPIVYRFKSFGVELLFANPNNKALKIIPKA